MSDPRSSQQVEMSHLIETDPNILSTNTQEPNLAGY